MLTLFPEKNAPARLPAGSFTVDRHGDILISTLPSNYPTKEIREIGLYAIRAFQAARNVQVPLSELVINYAALTVVAKELRGGAIIYLKPISLS